MNDKEKTQLEHRNMMMTELAASSAKWNKIYMETGNEDCLDNANAYQQVLHKLTAPEPVKAQN